MTGVEGERENEEEVEEEGSAPWAAQALPWWRGWEKKGKRGMTENKLGVGR